MKKYLFIVLLFGVCFGQNLSNDWIYYNNFSDNSVVPTMVRPDGSDSTSLADSSITFLHDVNETGTKFLYGNGTSYPSGSNLILQHGNSFEIFAENADQARFTFNENIIVYRKKIHDYKRQIISYSLIDSIHTVIVDSMPQNYNFVLSPTKDKIMYFNRLEDSREIIIVNIENGNTNTISNIPVAPVNTFFGRPYIWALNNIIYFNANPDTSVAYLGQLFSIDIDDENADPNQITFIEGGCSLLETYENHTNEIIIVKYENRDTLFTYNIIADYLATLGVIPGVATNYAWADDMSKIVFNTFTSIGFFGGVPGPLQVFDVNAGSSFTIPSSTWDYPIFWRQSNTANIKNSISPNNFSIFQNYPNPFNPITSLRYDLPEDGLVNITIYDMMGRVVKTLVNSSQTAGYKSIQWNATNDRDEAVSAGLYLYIIDVGEFRQTKKMVLVK